jgi:hypothetical protein
VAITWCPRWRARRARERPKPVGEEEEQPVMNQTGGWAGEGGIFGGECAL